jgi:hypothetical protein
MHQKIVNLVSLSNLNISYLGPARTTPTLYRRSPDRLY